VSVSVESYANAHSGATIWPVGDSDTGASMWGEVPLSQPSIVEQVDSAGRSISLPPATAPCIVLLDGGINDVSLTNIFTIDPTIWDKPAWISKVTTNDVGPRMQDLLAHVFAGFPQAYVIVTGYYEIVSANSERTAAARSVSRSAHCHLAAPTGASGAVRRVCPGRAGSGFGSAQDWTAGGSYGNRGTYFWLVWLVGLVGWLVHLMPGRMPDLRSKSSTMASYMALTRSCLSLT
jgi:hypothetical protein